MKKKRVWTSLKDLAEPHKQAIFEQRTPTRYTTYQHTQFEQERLSTPCSVFSVTACAPFVRSRLWLRSTMQHSYVSSRAAIQPACPVKTPLFPFVFCSGLEGRTKTSDGVGRTRHGLMGSKGQRSFSRRGNYKSPPRKFDSFCFLHCT